MTDTQNTTEETVDYDEMVEAKVLGAACSYFEVEHLRHPDGRKILKDGEPVTVSSRREARHGDVIQVSAYQYARLSAPDVAVLGPLNAVLSTDPSRPREPTPFGVPMPISDPDDPQYGQVAGYRGPVMGDPNPAGPGTPDNLLAAAAGGLSPEQAKEFHLQSLGKNDPEKGTDDTLFESYMEMGRENGKDSLVEYAKSDGIEVTRRDGRTDLEPTMEDYARAISAAEREPEAEEA